MFHPHTKNCPLHFSDQAVEVFMTDASRGSRAEVGLWCIGYIRENSAPESSIIPVCLKVFY
jgi:hypothetical protein